MLFNSVTFLAFFLGVCLLYFLLRPGARNALLLVSSLIFYGAWSLAYLGLMMATSLLDYAIGLYLSRTDEPVRRKALIGLSLASNLGMLIGFKYIPGVAEGFASLIGYEPQMNGPLLASALIPVGLSFYTFQAMGYTLDVYNRKITAERSLPRFLLFISFFPQLVAGPIERAGHMLDQFRTSKVFDPERVFSGLQLMAWGLFMKTVIADNLAPWVDTVYGSPELHNGGSLGMATVGFGLQIYFDFAGYSAVAIGAARVLGFTLMRNFANPYGANGIGPFWRRWHISLSTWFRDYVYFPLGGNRVAVPRWAINTMLVFALSGLWHGSSFTMLAWGVCHGTFLVVGRFTAGLRTRSAQAVGLYKLPWLHEALRVGITFILVMVAWVFFRATSFEHARAVFVGLLQPGFPSFLPLGKSDMLIITAALGLTIAGPRLYDRLQWRSRPASLRWMALYMVVLVTIFFGRFNNQAFIYFQF